MAAARTHAPMPKALCMSAMVISGIIGLIFAADLALGIPFDKASMVMDVCFLICAATTAFLGWSTFREQK